MIPAHGIVAVPRASAAIQSAIYARASAGHPAVEIHGNNPAHGMRKISRLLVHAFGAHGGQDYLSDRFR